MGATRSWLGVFPYKRFKVLHVGQRPCCPAQALRLALREEQRQRTTLADGLEVERAATAAAVRRVAELVSCRFSAA